MQRSRYYFIYQFLSIYYWFIIFLDDEDLLLNKIGKDLWEELDNKIILDGDKF